MLRVLQHYLPIRTALLFFGETAILTLVITIAMSGHLWEPMAGTRGDNYRELVLALGQVGLGFVDGFWVCVISALILALVSQIAIGFNQLYEFHISSSRFERASRFVESAGAALGMSLLLVSLTHFWKLSRVVNFPGLTYTQKIGGIIGSLVLGFVLLFSWRIVFHWLMRKANLNLRVLILGSQGPALELTDMILEHPEAGYEVAGMVPESKSSSLLATEEEHARTTSRQVATGRGVMTVDYLETTESRNLVLDTVSLLERKVINKDVAMSGPGGEEDDRHSLLALAREHNADMLVVALQDRRRALPIQDLLRCRLEGYDVREREETFEQITGKIAVTSMRPSYLIFNEGFRRHPWADLMKRVADFVLSLLLLIGSFPFMVLTAIAVAMDTPGPIFFSQRRVGQDGNRFTLVKFRSMRVDAEATTGPVWSNEDDPRITRVGKFIRKTRLDELPQLVNVLRGHMSLVGPRPERPHFVDDLSEQIPYYHLRHIVKPGLTGWAQVNYPYGSTVEDALHKLQYDLFYIKNHSLLFDLSVLFSTTKTVILRQGT